LRSEDERAGIRRPSGSPVRAPPLEIDVARRVERRVRDDGRRVERLHHRQIGTDRNYVGRVPVGRGRIDAGVERPGLSVVVAAVPGEAALRRRTRAVTLQRQQVRPGRHADDVARGRRGKGVRAAHRRDRALRQELRGSRARREDRDRHGQALNRRHPNPLHVPYRRAKAREPAWSWQAVARYPPAARLFGLGALVRILRSGPEGRPWSSNADSRPSEMRRWTEPLEAGGEENWERTSSLFQGAKRSRWT